MIAIPRIVIAGSLLGLPLLAGCSSPADKANARYEFVKANGGTLGDVCDAGHAALDAMSKAGDKRFSELRVAVAIECQTADQLGRNMPASQEDAAYSIEPDNMDALADNVVAP